MIFSLECGILVGWATLLTFSKGLQMSTTNSNLIISTDLDGIAVTGRGYLRYPAGHDYAQESECDVCNGEPAVARLADTGEGVCEDCRQEAVQMGESLTRL